VVLVGDHAADRLRVAEVAIGAQYAAGHAADAHAAPHLRDGALVMVAVDLEFSHDTLLSFEVLHISGWSAQGSRKFSAPWAFSELQGLWDSPAHKNGSAARKSGR
jgi:predicted Kef-type K+ transport protein